MKLWYNAGMGSTDDIIPPLGKDDVEGARRAFEAFSTLYRPALVTVEAHLDQLIEDMPPGFAAGYLPWRGALHDLVSGTYMLARKIPLPDTEGFMEALRLFSFESGIQFLRDLCLSCHIPLRPDWMQRFRQHIDVLLFAFTVMLRQQRHPGLSL